MDNYKVELNKKTTEELINDLNDLKKELTYMNESLNDNTVSSEQKAEFRNSDIPSVRDSIVIIEEILNKRKR